MDEREREIREYINRGSYSKSGSFIYHYGEKERIKDEESVEEYITRIIGLNHETEKSRKTLKSSHTIFSIFSLLILVMLSMFAYEQDGSLWTVLEAVIGSIPILLVIYLMSEEIVSFSGDSKIKTVVFTVIAIAVIVVFVYMTGCSSVAWLRYVV